MPTTRPASPRIPNWSSWSSTATTRTANAFRRSTWPWCSARSRGFPCTTACCRATSATWHHGKHYRRRGVPRVRQGEIRLGHKLLQREERQRPVPRALQIHRRPASGHGSGAKQRGGGQGQAGPLRQLPRGRRRLLHQHGDQLGLCLEHARRQGGAGEAPPA